MLDMEGLFQNSAGLARGGMFTENNLLPLKREKKRNHKSVDISYDVIDFIPRVQRTNLKAIDLYISRNTKMIPFDHGPW